MVPALLALAPVLLAAAPAAAQTTVEGSFTPINAHRTGGQSVEGTVRATLKDGDIFFEIEAKGLAPGAHAARIHGFPEPEPRAAKCPEVVADINRDGYIDQPELTEHTGQVLIPLDGAPENLDATAATGHPEAGPRGRLSWRKRTGFDALRDALKTKFNTPPALASRVVVIYGVPEGIRLPRTVRYRDGAGTEKAAPHDSVPIACATLRERAG